MFAYFRDNRDKKLFLEEPEGTTVKDILDEIQLNPDEVSIILKNGRDALITSILSNGDILSLFPPVGGG